MTGTAKRNRDERLDTLSTAFERFREGVRAVEPGAWALSLSDLTKLGYLHLALDIADAIADAGLPPNAHVLDWGAGPAFLTFLLQELGLRVDYYDFAEANPGYAYALSLLRGEKRFVEDPVRIPFADESFDAVISFGVLEHVPDPAGSVAEVMRMLKPGGLFLVYHFPNRYSWTENLAGALGRVHHDHTENRRGLRDLLAVPGTDVREMSYRYIIPRNLVDMPRVRGFVSRHARGIYALDAALTRVPLLNLLSTTHNVVVRKLAVGGRS